MHHRTRHLAAQKKVAEENETTTSSEQNEGGRGQADWGTVLVLSDPAKKTKIILKQN
jgi:hypothetical protein